MIWALVCCTDDKREPMPALTSFSPQILLMMELDAGLAEGPRTATTPLDMIWHTVNRQEKDQLSFITDREQKESQMEDAKSSAAPFSFKDGSL